MTVASKILMGSGAVDVPIDDEFDNVSFLSHFDGSNNGVNNVFDDGSASNHTMTAGGDVTQGTFSPFSRVDGEWSNYIGPGAAYNLAAGLGAASHSDFTLDGAYTIEFFVNLTSTADQYFFGIGDTSSGDKTSLVLSLASGTSLGIGGGTVLVFSTGSELTVDTWQHVAVTRNGSNLVTCWVDGTALGTTFTVTDDPSGVAVVGTALYSATYYSSVLGHMSNFRILKGTCLYTSNFTPPTAPLTAITNTKLLTCQSNGFVDNSASAHTLTAIQTPQVSAFTPILTSEVYDSAVNGASAIFDGSGDKLSAADSADWTLGDTFTIEAWIFPTTLAAYNIVLDHASGFYYSALSSGAMQVYKSGSQIDSAAVLVTNQWNHVAFAVSSGTGYHYINGARSGSSGSIDVGDDSAALTIGAYASGSWPFAGYMSNVRIVKGTAVYSGSTYTVPTAPLTAITNTVLLLNMADGQALDSAAQNNMTLLGNADTSTTQQKFGTSSLALDGSGDWVDIPANPSFHFGSAGNFTVELFIKTSDPSADSYDRRIYLNDGPAGNAVGNIMLLLATSSGNQGKVSVQTNTTILTSSTVVTDGAWHHIAMVRSSGTISLYIDGTSEGTPVSNTDNITGTGGAPAPRIGSYGTEGGNFNGYIDDIRVSRMARYTSNFTPTTEAFPDKGQ